MTVEGSTHDQWLFPASALCDTPSTTPLERELYDRARGVEFLFRLGASLQLPAAALFTAASWFHRFYMRYPMEDFHRQDVAGACIFLATKTEECGRKLRDVARVFQSKVSGVEVQNVSSDSPEVEHCQAAILLTEEVLLEAICFDFTINSPHADLVDLFDASTVDANVQDYAWSIAHDTFRTPLCVLHRPKVIAAACYVLAQKVVDGRLGPSLDARISWPAPSTTLPTPPSHQPASPDASRFAIEFFAFSSDEVAGVAEALDIIIEFYRAQDKGQHPHIEGIQTVEPPVSPPSRPKFYAPFSEMLQPGAPTQQNSQRPNDNQGTPVSSHGRETPAGSQIKT